MSSGILLAMLFGLLLVMMYVSVMLSQALLSSVEVSERTGLLMGSVIQNLLAFFVTAVLVASFSGERPEIFLSISEQLKPAPFLGVIIVYVIGSPLINQLVYWNENLSLPDSLAGLEETMRTWEQSAEKITGVILDTSSWAGLISGVLVIGVLTGFCEEIFFRGALQNILLRGGIRPWLSIGIAAVIFSAMHFQFFGFVPRMILGIFFGYLIYTTGTLWTAVLAHVLNNSTVVVCSWLTASGYKSAERIMSFGVEESGFPIAATVSGVCLVLFFIFFRRYFFKRY